MERVRENLGRYHKQLFEMMFPRSMNISLNQIFCRSSTEADHCDWPSFFSRKVRVQKQTNQSQSVVLVRLSVSAKMVIRYQLLGTYLHSRLEIKKGSFPCYLKDVVLDQLLFMRSLPKFLR